MLTFDRGMGNRKAHNRKIYPINTSANLNLSAIIQVSTIRFISTDELLFPALAMIASFIGNTITIDKMIPNDIVSRVINRKYLCRL